MGWPLDFSWYKLLTDWGNLFGGILALIAGIIAYVAGVVQARATRQAASIQVTADKEREQGRRRAYAAIGALEAQRIQVEAERQLKNIAAAVREKDDPHVEVRHTLSRIESREVFRSWEQLGSVESDVAFAVYW